MKKHKDIILYSVIVSLVVAILFMQKIIYVRVIDNAIIFGITKEEKPKDTSIWSGIDREQLDKQINWTDPEVDEILADARSKGWIK